ncbi:MAG: hypothetical protein E6G57_12855 [Actinobacteria bacterium]|nr:MAG: hypothetical protein E6G57_12855 [Actinomycetota bacterium]
MIVRYSSGLGGELDMQLLSFDHLGSEPDRLALGMLSVCLMEPRSRGSVRLTSRDPTVDPEVNFDLLSDELDMARMVAGLRYLHEIVGHYLPLGSDHQRQGRHREGDAKALDDMVVDQRRPAQGAGEVENGTEKHEHVATEEHRAYRPAGAGRSAKSPCTGPSPVRSERPRHRHRRVEHFQPDGEESHPTTVRGPPPAFCSRSEGCARPSGGPALVIGCRRARSAGAGAGRGRRRRQGRARSTPASICRPTCRGPRPWR